MVLEVTELTVGRSPCNQIRRVGGRKAGAICVLNKLSASFSKGITIILGPNGSGKSLLLKVLSGVVKPDYGQVILDGQVAETGLLRPLIGYLPQRFGLYPQYSAREMLHYIALLKGVSDRKTRETQVEYALERMGLLKVADRQVGQYSRGMLQKVGLAQVLLDNPSILLLDDPTAGLDPDIRNDFRNMMVELGQDRVIVWVSSLIADLGVGDRVLIIDRGERRFWGTPVELGELGEAGPLEAENKLEVAQTWDGVLESGYRAALAR